MKWFLFPDGFVGDDPSSKHNFRMLMALLSGFAALILVALLLTGCSIRTCNGHSEICYDDCECHNK